MPPTITEQIEQVIERATQEIRELLRRQVADSIFAQTKAPSLQLTQAQSDHKPPQRRQIMCPVDKCGEPGAGSRYGWFCAKHFELPAKEKEKWRKARKAKAGS